MGIPPRPAYPRSSHSPQKGTSPREQASARPLHKPRRARRRSPLGPRVLLGSCIAAIAIAGYVGFLALHSRLFARMMTNPTVANQFPGIRTMNMVIIGRDYDYNNSDQVIKTHARSDMLMVAHLDFAHDTVKLLSIPRDTRASIPGHGVHKINTAHSIGGPRLTVATVTRNYGIPIDHYVALDFQGFEQAIDLLHGVDVNVDRKMDYDDNWGHLHIHLLPGMQHLSGQQAMGFVRFRHADSDVVRTARQQSLIASLKLKLLQPGTLFAIPNILNTIDRHTDSDFTTDQKIAIAKFVRSAPKDNVQMQTLPSIEGSYYVYTDWDGASPLISKWFGVSPPKFGATVRHGERFASVHRSHILATQI